MKCPRAILFCVLVFTAATIAAACVCAPPPPPRQAMARCDAVFSGKCVDIVIKDHRKVCTFEVDRVWKGEVGAKVVVTTAMKRPELSSNHGFNFTTTGDAVYLVYAFGKPDELTTNNCTRTCTLANAKSDLKELGGGEKPANAKQ